MSQELETPVTLIYGGGWLFREVLTTYIRNTTLPLSLRQHALMGVRGDRHEDRMEEVCFLCVLESLSGLLTLAPSLLRVHRASRGCPSSGRGDLL